MMGALVGPTIVVGRLSRRRKSPKTTWPTRRDLRGVRRNKDSVAQTSSVCLVGRLSGCRAGAAGRTNFIRRSLLSANRVSLVPVVHNFAQIGFVLAGFGPSMAVAQGVEPVHNFAQQPESRYQPRSHRRLSAFIGGQFFFSNSAPNPTPSSRAQLCTIPHKDLHAT
jgi:hypothetical protein